MRTLSESLAHLKPEYREKIMASIELKRKQREEDELREEENIPWLRDILPYVHSTHESNTWQMPNYTSKLAGEIGRFILEGHSMTCANKNLSLPEGSKIIARRLPNDTKAIPLNKSLIIIWQEDGEKKCYCKTISNVGLRFIQCVSLNPDPYYEPFKVWLNDIIEIFEVEQVIKPVRKGVRKQSFA